MKIACLGYSTGYRQYPTVKMRVFWITVLLWNLNLSLLHSLTCDEGKEYRWEEKKSVSDPNPISKCCNKCKPGEHMVGRCPIGSKETKCKPCSMGMYISMHNALSRCDVCRDCGYGQEEVKPCNTLTDRECRCKPDHKCGDDDCSYCKYEKPKETTTTTATTTTTTITTTTHPTITDVKQPERTTLNKEPDDTAMLLPVVLIVCVCILLLIIATQLKKLDLGCLTFDDSSSKDTQSIEEETLRLPEVCTDLQEVWIKDGSDHLNGQVTEGILC
ncbi:tumor necrosis factor receptor superfamily member 1A isoform X2 [Sardina pilchardus]|uniref:tumor necrosis factor receptor superfamily member 1A isoform X2 n=1 Tax=Sardina pilchardus TaxID=27697 RepID=UPI002E163D15